AGQKHRDHRRRYGLRGVPGERENPLHLSIGIPRSGHPVTRDFEVRLSAGQRQPAGSPRRRTNESGDATGLSPGARRVHDQRAANQLCSRNTGDAMKLTIFAIIVASALSACNRSSPLMSQASAASPAPAATDTKSTAHYFTVPADQLAHLQLVDAR